MEAVPAAGEGWGAACCTGTRVAGDADEPAEESVGRGCVLLWEGGTRVGGVADEPADGGPPKPGGGGCAAAGAGMDGVFADEPVDADAGGAPRTSEAPFWITHRRGSASRRLQ